MFQNTTNPKWDFSHYFRVKPNHHKFQLNLFDDRSKKTDKLLCQTELYLNFLSFGQPGEILSAAWMTSPTERAFPLLLKKEADTK
jgi:hypothetical protein